MSVHISNLKYESNSENRNMTSDWEKIKIDGVNHVDLGFSIDINVAKVTFGEYEVKFDMVGQCCEQYGVHFHDPEHRDWELDLDVGWNVVYTKKEEIPSIIEKVVHHFDDLNGCQLKMKPDGYNTGGSFDLIFDDGRSISFYNHHNGYYSHYFEIYKNGDLMFISYL